MAWMNALQFNEQGLIPAVIQDQASQRVLTLCYLNREALEKTCREGKVYVFRRSQNKLMLKGETSGHIQLVKGVFIDCEGKSLVIQVEQKMAGCHQGYFTCYFRQAQPDGSTTIVDTKRFDPGSVYR